LIEDDGVERDKKGYVEEEKQLGDFGDRSEKTNLTE